MNAPAGSPDNALVLSIVIPCLNEAETLEGVLRQASAFLEGAGIPGEVVVADNGSTDGSIGIAERCGAVVVPVTRKGYGNALRGGIEGSRGRYVVMGDADGSYDFSSLGPFLEKLDEGHDLVMGNRFRGGIRPGAMPWLHRWLGNPVLSAIGRILFRSPIGDFHCGLRAFRRTAYDRMDLQSTGMEFASEMVIKGALLRMRVTEVPTVLSPDGRSRPPHLRTWRDGWRHLRFMMLFSPRWLFLVPGIALVVVGAAVQAVLAPGPLAVGAVVFDIHTMFLGGLAVFLGYQLVVFALFTKLFAIREGYHPEPGYPSWILRIFQLEVGLAVGAVLALVGLLLVGAAVAEWSGVGFGDLDPRFTMRRLIPGASLLVTGVQTMYSSLFLSILGLGRR